MSTSVKNLSDLTQTVIFLCVLATALQAIFSDIISVDIHSRSLLNVDTRACNRSFLVFDAQLFLQPRILSQYKNCSFGFSVDPTENSNSLISADSDDGLQASEVSVLWCDLDRNRNAAGNFSGTSKFEVWRKPTRWESPWYVRTNVSKVKFVVWTRTAVWSLQSCRYCRRYSAAVLCVGVWCEANVTDRCSEGAEGLHFIRRFARSSLW
jgi:hypothetical protein